MRLNKLLLAILIAFPALGWAQSITKLPAASVPLSGAEIVPLVQGGVTKQSTIGSIAAAATWPSIGPYTVLGNGSGSPNNAYGLPLPSCSGSANALTWQPGSGFGCNNITVSAGAAGTTGQVQYNNGGVLGGFTISGDGTLSNIGALTVTKTNGTPFAAVATSGSASDLSTGNLSVNRLNGGSGASGTTFWRGDGTWSTIGATYVTGPGSSTSGYVPTWGGTSGTALAAGIPVGTSGAAIPLLNGANTWSGVQTYTNSDFALLGSSTGATTFTSDNASGTNYTQHVAAGNGYLLTSATNMTANPATGTPSATTFLRGDGTWATPSGSGTITSSSIGQVPVYTGSTTVAGSTNFTISTGALTLGASGTLGSVQMGNATSGTVTLQPVSGALGTVTASLPANTGTVAETNLAQTFSATQTFADGTTITSAGITAAKNLGTKQVQETGVSLSGCNGSTATMDLSAGTYFYCTVSTGATTFAVSNVATTGLVSSFTLEITNGGSQTINWMSGTKWPGGTAPTLTASGVDLLVFSTRDGGTTWRGVASEVNSK